MKPFHESTQNLQSENLAADVAARVAPIFESYPLLCGFSVQNGVTLTKDRALVVLQDELYLADLSLSAPLSFPATQELCEQIAYMLLELMDERPEVSVLLAGCTFARTLH